ncbi:MAG: GntR family transcriptional regulator [Cohaesibacter sp.]|nr:GntR family transcriptional regulator [Cohaesibacter sp.]MCV6603021.1 GntR family transcriptional regulator [Cohaesibacter sp.]
MARLVRRTTTHIVADEIRQRILNGELREGEQIRQEAIATELGVSRIPVREALRQLEAEGLITLVSHKGAEVTRLEPTEIAELFEVRVMLENWLFSLAIDHITASDLESAEGLIDAMRNDAKIEDWGNLNWQFHEALYRPANRPATVKILRRVHDNIDRYVRLQIALTEDAKDQAHADHQGLVDAARAGNKQQGKTLLTSHIENVKDQLLDTIKEKES